MTNYHPQVYHKQVSVTDVHTDQNPQYICNTPKQVFNTDSDLGGARKPSMVH